jgi:mono/diheme cytochrome c family protein
MDRQADLRPFGRQMPEMPSGTAPASPALLARAGQTPEKSSAATIALGERYYVYYCAFCHGTTGKGDLPVGQSYNPRPTDLTSDAVQRMTEAELCAAMVTGVGHEPALAATVAPSRRPAIARYVHTFR